MHKKTVPSSTSWIIIIIFAILAGYFCLSNVQKIDNGLAFSMVNIPKVEIENDFIKVSKPKPYQLISSPLVILGEANVFEATVNYRLKDARENILTEGFATTAGSFELNPFRQEIEFSKPQTETGVLEVFEVSAKNGSDRNKISIPIYFE